MTDFFLLLEEAKKQMPGVHNATVLGFGVLLRSTFGLMAKFGKYLRALGQHNKQRPGDACPWRPKGLKGVRGRGGTPGGSLWSICRAKSLNGRNESLLVSAQCVVQCSVCFIR